MNPTLAASLCKYAIAKHLIYCAILSTVSAPTLMMYVGNSSLSSQQESILFVYI
jgi:hypothetical protein